MEKGEWYFFLSKTGIAKLPSQNIYAGTSDSIIYCINNACRLPFQNSSVLDRAIKLS